MSACHTPCPEVSTNHGDALAEGASGPGAITVIGASDDSDAAIQGAQ